MNSVRLSKYGQSCWLDNLTRRMIADGGLARRVNEEELAGVTSNPAIFHKAIVGSGDYDEQIRQGLLVGRSGESIAGKRWRALAQQGAWPQRLLWASTGTKNPTYRDVMYVEPLIGAFTVNTMPEETIAAFADHGEAGNTVVSGIDEARRVMAALEDAGIDFRLVTRQLEAEGIQKFIEPYDALLEFIEGKRAISRHASDVRHFPTIDSSA